MSPYPRLRLDFYSSAVIMSQWEDDGRCTAHPVSVHDVVTACSNIELGSGLLPANTLFWQQKASHMVLGVYVPARRWQVQTADHSYYLPLPPFVFVGKGTGYQIFAVKKRPLSENDLLYYAPCPNVHTSGAICSGNTPFTPCSPGTIQSALTLFMEGSQFNADLSGGKCKSYPDDVRRLWAELDGRKRFPLSELVSGQRTVHSLL